MKFLHLIVEMCYSRADHGGAAVKRPLRHSPAASNIQPQLLSTILVGLIEEMLVASKALAINQDIIVVLQALKNSGQKSLTV